MSEWTRHRTSDGRVYYYDRITSVSTWIEPTNFMATQAKHTRPELSQCLDSSPAVAALVNAILKYCGVQALPLIHTDEDATSGLCDGGRGGAYCCRSNKIFICRHPWVGCREVAYELAHALNVCRGLVACSKGGITLQGEDCGYLSPPAVACSELRASQFAQRCAAAKGDASRNKCAEWHAAWAVRACYPDDSYTDAHVRWARYRCHPHGEDVELVAPRASAFVDQAFRW